MAEEPGEIREEIEATREALANTIEALGQKADVKGRVSEALQNGARTAREHVVESAAEARSRLSPDSPDPSQTLIGSGRPARPEVAAGDQRTKVAVGVGVFVLLSLVRRRRKRKRRAAAA